MDALQWDVTSLIPFYAEEHDACFQKTVKMEREYIVFIEGVFLQCDEWRRSFFDYVAYLDCPRDRRFR